MFSFLYVDYSVYCLTVPLPCPRKPSDSDLCCCVRSYVSKGGRGKGVEYVCNEEYPSFFQGGGGLTESTSFT